MRTLIASLMILAMAGAASAAVTVTAGDHDLLPNTAGQTIQILISTDNSDLTTGVVANVHIGTGQSCPDITLISLETAPEIFAATNGDTGGYVDYTASTYPGISSIDFLCTAADGSDDVVASGVLATVTIDTTGFTGVATWDLDISGGLAGALSMLYSGSDPGTTLVDGTITIPEPATMLLLGLGAVAAIIRRR